MLESLPYRYIVPVDFEFDVGGHASFEDASRSGARPRPVCAIAKELRSGQTWRLWRGEFPSKPPFPIGPDALFVAYYASAELGAFALWAGRCRPIFSTCSPNSVTAPMVSQRSRVPAWSVPWPILGSIASAQSEKDEMRACDSGAVPVRSAMRKFSITARQIQTHWSVYCQRCFRASISVAPFFAVATWPPPPPWNGMACRSTPPHLELLRKHWTDIQDDLIAAIDADYGVYEGRTFKIARFEAYFIRQGIPWPRLKSGSLDMSRAMFRQMAKSYAVIAPLHELRHAISEMRLNDLAVGHDGRNRTILSAFRARTSRNQPSNTKFIFGPSTWLRGLIQPPPGHAVAYVDWSNQEFGIAAKLSGDEQMMAAYQSGDPYLAFGKQCGKLPPDATKASHPDTRQLLKGCVLGVLSGWKQNPRLSGNRKSWPANYCVCIVRRIRNFGSGPTPPSTSRCYISLHTVFGWHVHVGENPNPRSLQNFPMQANGAEMMRMAACLATERGIEVCAPVHDAFLICAPIERIDEEASAMRSAMIEASRPCRTGSNCVSTSTSSSFRIVIWTPAAR